MTTHSSIEKQATQDQQSCMCLHLQKAACVAARQFDDAFRPLDLTSGQYSLLIALVRQESPSIGQLAENMAMDRTTVTANIKPLKKRGLLETVVDPTDARSRLLVLTPKGEALLKKALPLWQLAQAKLIEALSTNNQGQLLNALRKAAE